MKKNTKIIVLVAWGIVLAVLIGIGISRMSVKEQRFGQVEDVVAVTGPAVSSDVSRTEEPETVSSTDVSDAEESETVSSRSGDESAKGAGEDASSKAKRSSSKKDPTEKSKPRETEASDRQAGSEGSSDSSAPENTAVSEETESPTPKPTEKPVYRFTIECRRILDRPELWRDGLEEVIPENGVFFTGTRDYVKGETVYEALKDICEELGILLDSRYTPIYETYYISGIGNLYEFDCGSESGWKYSVNGTLPGVGCSRYTIRKGDEIVFFYDTEV